jgi:trans-2,3-dihydro-3-hydroxyanthranilate isomerase
VLPSLGTDAVYAYVRGDRAGELHARMFSPIDACTEDAATGSATAATIALLARRSHGAAGEREWRVTQGADMGRPSILLGRTISVDDRVAAVHVGGHVVEVMRGNFEL